MTTKFKILSFGGVFVALGWLGYFGYLFWKLHDFPAFLLIANCEARDLEIRSETRPPLQTHVACVLREKKPRQFFMPQVAYHDTNREAFLGSIFTDLTMHYFFCKTPAVKFVDEVDAKACAEAMRRSMHWVLDQKFGILDDPRLRSEHDCSSLHVALDSQDWRLWEKLIDQGADPDEAPDWPCTWFNKLNGLEVGDTTPPQELKQAKLEAVTTD